MSLIKSISGIRGTIGGQPGEGLSPEDIVKFTAAYATFVKRSLPAGKRPTVVVGRDARISGRWWPLSLSAHSRQWDATS